MVSEVAAVAGTLAGVTNTSIWMEIDGSVSLNYLEVMTAFLFILKVIVHTSLPACMSLQHMCTVLTECQGFGFIGSGVTDCYEPPHGLLGIEPRAYGILANALNC